MVNITLMLCIAGTLVILALAATCYYKKKCCPQACPPSKKPCNPCQPEQPLEQNNNSNDQS